ncbi:hypothetical protein ACFMQL_32585 [Nonomuraea fastidiosa]|uniref:hypothetical protein n=1 Tax=Nonomuraea TaxID=83681 RepID=UPI003441615C
MAQLLRRLDDEVHIEYNTFGLDGTDLLWSSPTEEIHHFTAAVRLESWDAEPEPADASWTPVSTQTFVAERGVVAITSMMEYRGHDFLIGPPHFEYGVQMYLREPRPGDGHGTGKSDETWMLRFWPIRDVFDPIEHAAPEHYFVPGVGYHSIDIEPERLVPPPARRKVPVPVSAVSDWVSLCPDPDLDTFDGWLRRERRTAEADGVTIYQRLRAHGIDIEDGADLTLAACAPPYWRAGRYEDPVIDCYYAEQARRDSFANLAEYGLRERADADRIAKELCRRGTPTFSVPVERRSVAPGDSLRVWRWETDYLGGALRGGGLTVDRQVVAENPWTRQILVSGIVTILRSDETRHCGGGPDWYAARNAEPHEAARVLCAEATWEEDPEQRRALDELVKEKLAELRAAHGSGK